jgi:protein-disulfide isomerase
MRKQKIVLACGMAAVAAVGVGAGLYWRGQAARSLRSEADSTHDAGALFTERSRGDTAAPITVFEFSDFQCPFCRRFSQEILPVLEREYIATGKLRLIFVNYPIPQLHPNAAAAHNFAMCAARQKQFWPVHDLLFHYQREWEKLADPNRFFRKLADSVSLNRPELAICMDRKTEDWLVQAEAREAGTAGVRGTPAFVINGGLLPGAQPMEVWRPILDSIFAASQKRAG